MVFAHVVPRKGPELSVVSGNAPVGHISAPPPRGPRIQLATFDPGLCQPSCFGLIHCVLLRFLFSRSPLGGRWKRHVPDCQDDGRGERWWWGEELALLAANIATRNKEGGGKGERRRLTKDIASDRRRLRRKEAVARLAMKARPNPALQTQEGGGSDRDPLRR